MSSSIKKFNLFLSGTEYHFLMTTSLIEQYYSNGEFQNLVILNGYRSSEISTNDTPEHIDFVRIDFNNDKNSINEIRTKLLNNTVHNLFIFHPYKTLEAFLIYHLRNSAKVHLVEDGALFYHIMEKRGTVSRIRMTLNIYKELFKLKLNFRKLLFYRFHMWDSDDVQALCMTRPSLFIGRSTTKKEVIPISLFPTEESLTRCQGYFKTMVPEMVDTLLYISFKVYTEEHALAEIKLLQFIFSKSGKKNLVIKLHPASRIFQIRRMKEAFAEKVIFNNIPAEIFIARSSNSDIYSVASTSLFYLNPSCKYYSLKLIYQKLGLYENWKNVQLPDHVIMIDSFEVYHNLLNEG